MRILNLIENTEGRPGCAFAHGLSFYIESGRHRLLLDLGPSGETLENAKVLGVRLEDVDTVVLSHGHYDHSGGIMPFTEINDKAVIYMQAAASDGYFSDDGENAKGDRYRYIGIDSRILSLPQVKLLHGDFAIDDGIGLFTIRNRTHELPFSNRPLMMMRNGQYLRDTFEHEQFLVIKEDEKRILLSGCAHNGILSILDAYKEKYGGCPDAVVSGFHLMKKTDYLDSECDEIRAIARELAAYPTMFYTCHCTGLFAYGEMKAIMGDKLRYIHTGEEI